MDPIVAQRHLRLGPVDIDLGARRIRRAGAADARLTPIEHRLLTRLVEADGVAVSQEDLLRDVWGYRSLQTRTLATTVRRLRSKIEAHPHEPVTLVTVPNVGYRLEVDRQRPPPTPAVPGREVEVALLTAAWGEARLVTVVGPPGADTGRVAQEVAAAHGAVHIRWTGDGWRDLSHAMGWPVAEPGEESVASLAGRAGPLVGWLDREPDGPPVDPRFVAALLAANPSLRVLVDAGQPLRLPGERVVACGGLPPEVARQLLGPGDAAVLDAIALAVDHLPLALTLVRPWVEWLGAEEVLRLLRGGSTLDRADTPGLRQLVEGALSTLPAVSRTTLRALAAFADTASLQDLSAVSPAAATGLPPLLEQRLVHRTATGHFRPLALVRRHVRAHEPAEADAAFVSHLASFGTPEALRLVSAVGAATAVARLSAVRNDLARAHALALTFSATDDAARIALAAAAAAGWWGDADAASALLEATLPRLTPGPLAAQVAAAWCELERSLGRSLRVKLALAPAAPDDDPELSYGRASVLCGLGELDDAATLLTAALARTSPASDVAGRLHTALSILASAQGRLSLAEPHLRSALEIHQALGNARRVALLLPRAAVLEARLGRAWSPMLEAGRNAIEALDDTEGLAVVASAEGYLQARDGSPGRAHECFLEAAERYRELGHVENAVRMELDAAGAAVNLGAWEEPWRMVSALLPVARRRGDRQAEARALFTLGDLCCRRQDYTQARAYLVPAAAMTVQESLLEQIRERLLACG